MRDLLLVEDYYFEDVATGYPCDVASASNPNLSWKVTLFGDSDATVSLGCVALGHDPAHFAADGCQSE